MSHCHQVYEYRGTGKAETGYTITVMLRLHPYFNRIAICLTAVLIVAVLLAGCLSPATPATPSATVSTSPTITRQSITPVAASPTASPSPSISIKTGTVIRDIQYTSIDGKALLMDIYYPKFWTQPCPAVLHIHGGGWTQGNKNLSATDADVRALTERGFLVASIDYRLAPEYRFPAMIEDCKCAVRFLRAHAAEYGINPDKIGAWGKSAGGHLAALLGLAGSSAGFEGTGGYAEYSSAVQAVADWYGPTDLPELFRTTNSVTALTVFGTVNSDNLTAASPVKYVSGSAPPFLLVHGDRDVVVPVSQSYTLHQKLIAESVYVELVVVNNAGHGFSAANGAINPSRAQITEITAKFFETTLK